MQIAGVRGCLSVCLEQDLSSSGKWVPCDCVLVHVGLGRHEVDVWGCLCNVQERRGWGRGKGRGREDREAGGGRQIDIEH